ncbi:transposase [Inconstantimicrobium mannanitabidum]|uniref:Uncharacterized protein n=1 Tax=Inconstantimicrobium mannanitabidum TaxID=1604901 RepID=A0ACB5R7L0_9CLOT|nr:transposase [Clostridium sp. TW13]GKX65152.1 hypothetical protein rsdtw13_04100 [Clostridium sp. TW13]
MISRRKGGQNRTWTKEEKLHIVRRYFDESIVRPILAKDEGISIGMISTWIHKYLDDGEAGLENKKKPGNKFDALYKSKSMNELDRLRLIAAKQEIKIEILKKDI